MKNQFHSSYMRTFTLGEKLSFDVLLHIYVTRWNHYRNRFVHKTQITCMYYMGFRISGRQMK